MMFLLQNIKETNMSDELHATLKDHLGWRNQRVACFVQILFAIFQARTVNLASLADFMNPDAEKMSNYRRIQRFFTGAFFCESTIARLLFSFFA